MNYIDEHDINYSRYGFESLALAHPEIDIKGLWHCDSKYYVLIEKDGIPVSYTHLTLPTICSV